MRKDPWGTPVGPSTAGLPHLAVFNSTGTQLHPKRPLRRARQNCRYWRPTHWAAPQASSTGHVHTSMATLVKDSVRRATLFSQANHTFLGLEHFVEVLTQRGCASLNPVINLLHKLGNHVMIVHLRYSHLHPLLNPQIQRGRGCGTTEVKPLNQHTADTLPGDLPAGHNLPCLRSVRGEDRLVSARRCGNVRLVSPRCLQL
mmetsp:Transcript_59597/g.134499  ORF Transcript_59597/g.134499 Transcript_59597/m.134499 type:complete len:201 (-) Transcript_59597:300-902(-)